MTDYFAQRGVSEIKHALEALRGRHVYLKVSGDTDPTPYQGFVSEIGEATVEITNVSDPEPGVSATRLREEVPPTPAMQERSRVRLDHIISITEVTIAKDQDPDLNPESVMVEVAPPT